MQETKMQRFVLLLHCFFACFSLFPASVLSQGGARYPRFAQCLSGGTLAGRGGAESYNLDCISCSSVVTVDPARGSDCISRPGNDLDGSVCNDLDPVLESIMLGHTTSTSCIEVSVMPKAVGKYVVLARGNQAITQSVLLRGRSEVCCVIHIVMCW